MKALIIIDIQNGLTKRSLYNKEKFFNTVNAAIENFRNSDSKIIFFQHNNDQLRNATSEWEIDGRINRREEDPVLQKKHSNAFQHTGLKKILDDSAIGSLTIAGLVSHGCVKATCLGAINEGFKTSLLINGHTSWNKDAASRIAETESDLTRAGVIMLDPDDPQVSQRSLHDLSIHELGQLFPIILQDYSDQWMEMYQAESRLIAESLSPSDIIQIDHIGSTAIPGIKAKPTIDILLQVSERIDLGKLKNTFKLLGYQINEHLENPPPHLTFVKGYTPEGFKGQAYHVHVRYRGNWAEIGFRDYLIGHKETARKYEALKQELAVRYKNDREAYTNAKTEFIETINKLTRENNT